MTDRELMHQALEALNRSDYLGWQLNIPIIKALRERLAQPELEQAITDAIIGGTGVMLGDKRIDPASIYKRQWQGLTDEEIEEACVPLGAIEVKLKDKNL